MHYTYACKTLRAASFGYVHLQNHIWVSKLKAAYVGWLYFRNQWVTLHCWVSSPKCSFCLQGLLTESPSFNTLIGPLS